MHPLPDLSIRQLEYLVAVAEAPTWAVAAERVGVSPSALSQGLAELERRVGVTMFERDGRRRHVRAGAEPVVDHARQVLALTGDLTDWAQRLRSGHGGRVRLGLIDVAAVVHFPDTLERFRAAHTDVELRLRVAPSAELLELLANGQLDVVVCVEPPTGADRWDLSPLMVEQIAAYPPAGAAAPGPTWGPWVMFPEGSHTRQVVMAELARRRETVDVVAESHQPEVLREMVRLGLGWTALPVSQAEAGERALQGAIELTRRRLVVARRHGVIADPAVDALVERLHAHADDT